MVGNDPALAAQMPGWIFIDSRNPGWHERFIRMVKNSSPEHTTILMPKASASQDIGASLVANRVWLAYDVEKDFQSREALERVRQMAEVTGDLGGINTRNLLQAFGANISSYQLPENKNFYIVNELLQNKAMVQLQNELYAKRRVEIAA